MVEANKDCSNVTVTVLTKVDEGRPVSLVETLQEMVAEPLEHRSVISDPVEQICGLSLQNNVRREERIGASMISKITASAVPTSSGVIAGIHRSRRQ